MKFFISFILLNILTAFSASAAVRTEIKTISKFQFDGTELSVSYRMGGGCEAHTGDIQLSLDKESKIVSIKIFDVTPKEDLCEAYIAGSVSINLKEKVAELLIANGLNAGNAWSVQIEFPKVEVQPFL